MNLEGTTLTNVGKDMAQPELSYTAGEVTTPSFQKMMWHYLLMLEIFTPYDPATYSTSKCIPNKFVHVYTKKCVHGNTVHK